MTDRPSTAFPAGLQTLLAMAAADPAAARALLHDRAAVASASGLALTATEQEILRGIPEPALRQAIRQLEPTLPDPERRSLLELAAATLAGLAALGLVTSPRGSASPYEYRPPAAAPLGAAKPTGIRPDHPQVLVESVTVSRGLSEAKVRAEVLRHGPTLVVIYRLEVLARQRGAEVSLDATLDLSPAGKVLAVTGVSARPAADRFRDRVVEVLRSIPFPAPGPKGGTVGLALRFVAR